MNRIAASCALVLALTAAGPPPDPALLYPATLSAKAPAKYDVALKTSQGTVVVEATRAWSPRGADRFYNLVKHGFFTGATFFRVVPGFVVQFGLNPSSSVNKAWSGANIKDDAVTQSNRVGYLSFASAGPNTRTTQLFINLGDNARLDGMGFSPFAKVVSGMNVVRKIYAGYGESPDQNEIVAKGNAYLDKNFSALDRILSAKIVPVASAAHSTHAHR